jgi:hypothetical protein
MHAFWDSKTLSRAWEAQTRLFAAVAIQAREEGEMVVLLH